jgi:hypothetical protein
MYNFSLAIVGILVGRIFNFIVYDLTLLGDFQDEISIHGFDSLLYCTNFSNVNRAFDLKPGKGL